MEDLLEDLVMEHRVLIHRDANVARVFQGKWGTLEAVTDKGVRVAVTGCCGRHHVAHVSYGEFSYKRQTVTDASMILDRQG